MAPPVGKAWDKSMETNWRKLVICLNILRLINNLPLDPNILNLLYIETDWARKSVEKPLPQTSLKFTHVLTLFSSD